MYRFVLSLGLSLLFCLSLFSQSDLNLDFEKKQNDFPTGWEVLGDDQYQIHLDSTTVKSGKYAVVIENNTNVSGFKMLSINLPDNYQGKEIRLKGSLKTENVQNGYAGLWMRIDPGVAVEDMSEQGITGTTDWKEYEISLPLHPEKTEQIALGGLLVGKGKMWLDNLQIYIDGKNISKEKVKIYHQEYPADKDREFDKGSSIKFSKPSENQIENLELLGRIWGFLKYHHPAIAEGNFNWDYKLFRFLPEYQKVKTSKERDSLLVGWIKSLGEIPTCEECENNSEDAVLKPDHSWMNTDNISVKLRKKLNEVYLNRTQGEQYYISLYPTKNPKFKNEKSYENISFPDDGFSLLSLFRFWNMVEYFSPYKNLTDKDWGKVLRECIPKFINIQNRLEYEKINLQIISELHDSHTQLSGNTKELNRLKGDYFAPFKADFIENQLIVTDFYHSKNAKESNLKIGDIITHINGKPVKQIINSLRPYSPASNEAARLKTLSLELLRSPKKEVPVKYISADKTHEKEIPFFGWGDLKIMEYYETQKQGKSYEYIKNNIGYINLEKIKVEDIPRIKEKFQKAEGIIVDIRNYPNIDLTNLMDLASYFITKPTSFMKFSSANINNPGEFVLGKPLIAQPDEKSFQGDLIILTNSQAQSYGETAVMLF